MRATLPLRRFEPFLLVVVASYIYTRPLSPLVAAVADGRSRHLGFLFLLFDPTCFRLSVVRIHVEFYLGLTTGK
jgi:hypothetical protein